MNDNMNGSEEGLPEHIGGYDVKAEVHHIGPIVWTDAQRRLNGMRITDFESTEVSALPPELTAHRTNRLALGVVAGVLEEFILTELRQRSGQAVSLDQVLSSSELVGQALIVIPPQGAPIVHLNEEADEAEIPPYYAWIRLERERYTWRVQADWLPQFPEPVIERVRVAVAQLAEAIIKGDEEKARNLARLSFPGIWGDSSKPLREEMHKEIYVLLFGTECNIMV